MKQICGGTLNLKQKLLLLKQFITVEPVLASYIFTLGLCRPALTNLRLEKSCRVNLHLPPLTCDAILSGNHWNFTKENHLTQLEISNMSSWLAPLQSVMPLILVVFLGSFSDRNKWRKPFLLLPLFGEIVSITGCVLCVVFMEEWPLEILGVAQNVVSSCFGGQTMLVMASISYIADNSTLEMRTLRVGVVQIVISVFSMSVQWFSGLLFVEIGYIAVLLLGIFLLSLGLLYGFLCINEPKKIARNNKSLLKDIFNPSHALDTFKLLFRRQSESNPWLLVLALLIIFMYKCAFIGETSVVFLYTQNVFHWTPVEFGYFLAANSLVTLIGTSTAILLFTKVLKLDDLSILLIALSDKIIANIIFGLSSTVFSMYVGVVVSIVTGLTRVANRSLATKVVSENDIGKAQSLFGICEAVVPSVAIPIYNKLVYNNTIEMFPSAFYFFSIILYVCCCFIAGIMILSNRKEAVAVNI